MKLIKFASNELKPYNFVVPDLLSLYSIEKDWMDRTVKIAA